MAGSVSSELRAEPNLTPLLDVVFQLITFFMLVFRISGDNFDQRVHLPVAGSARPAEGREADVLILNIDANGQLLWQGEPYDLERAIREISNQAKLVRLNQKIEGKVIQEGERLPTTIIFRADRAMPFSQIYRYITACQANGFHKFQLKAMSAEG
jgi:biopolymer transport protein ExbD